jgi:hypothetical protein
VLPAANPDRVHPTDFDHASALIAAALSATRTMLSELEVTERAAA